MAWLEPLRNIISIVSSGRRGEGLAQGLWLSTAAQSDRAEFGFRESRTQADPAKSQDWGFGKGQT